MPSLLELPTELRLKIWSFCSPDSVEVIVCLCFNDENVHSKCWDARQCLTIEINEDIHLPTPPLLLVCRKVNEESKQLMRPHLTLILCRYVCTIMFLYNSTVRQRALVDRIRLTHGIDRPLWRPANHGNNPAYLEGLLAERLKIAATRYYHIVGEEQVPAERREDAFLTVDVAVREVNFDEPSSESAVEK
jgi:2EXR family